MSSAADLVWALGGVKGPAQYGAESPFCFHPSYLQEEISDFCFLLGQRWTCSMSVQSSCGNLRHSIIVPQNICPDANFCPS